MPSDLIHTAPSLKSIDVVVSTASRLPGCRPPKIKAAGIDFVGHGFDRFHRL